MKKSSLFDWTPNLPLCCDLSFEKAAMARGYRRIAGVDEVGRGALFGPVCAGVVILDLTRVPYGIDDSKKLTIKQRLQLAENIRGTALDYSIAFVEAATIDRINILEATKEAMRLALRGLKQSPDFVLCDGLCLEGLSIPQTGIIKGDARSMSIGAASILAKVERDGLISRLAGQFPGYDLERNKGYGTSQHLAALRRWGPTSLHRRTFRGVCQEGDLHARSSKVQPAELWAGRPTHQR